LSPCCGLPSCRSRRSTPTSRDSRSTRCGGASGSVVLEFDSYAFHATRAAFERDRTRTAVLQRARYVVLRTTWNELTEASHALVARTAEALALSAG
jgi:hypothetical protein